MNPSECAALGERLEAVRERLVRAAHNAGRAPEDTRLIAVSKLHPAEAIAAAATFGQRVFGENYVQEALAKQDELAGKDVEWHFIGHVQTNKAKDVSGRFTLIHTVDSLKFAETLARRLPETVARQGVLLQVNIGDEPQKAGVAIADLPALAEAVFALPQLEVRGLMCLPPVFDAGEGARPYFARLRELRDALEARLGVALPELSMGMSGDCSQAVEEGATLVRVGTDIFGPRSARAL
ncbi:MAG: YggS family pyridoxal phosphate-dependent enzyme [Bilophila sp.]